MTLRVFLGAFLLLSLSGCFKVGPKTEEDVYQDLTKQFDELLPVLQRVRDDVSAKDALPRIKKIGEHVRELKALKDRFDRAGPSAKSEDMRKKYEQPLFASIARTMTQLKQMRQIFGVKETAATKEATEAVQAILETMGIKLTRASHQSL